jgi:hypothetical protein
MNGFYMEDASHMTIQKALKSTKIGLSSSTNIEPSSFNISEHTLRMEVGYWREGNEGKVRKQVI